MKNKFKKSIALLATGALLTASAAAYAAQLPVEPDSSAALTSSSQQEIITDIGISYSLEGDRLHLSLTATPQGYQFRLASFFVAVGRETENGDFVPVGDTPFSLKGPSTATLDLPFKNYNGERIWVRVSVTGEAFRGYEYVGSSTASKEFYFTL